MVIYAVMQKSYNSHTIIILLVLPKASPKLELSAQYHSCALHFLMPFSFFHTIIAPTSALGMLLLYAPIVHMLTTFILLGPPHPNSLPPNDNNATLKIHTTPHPFALLHQTVSNIKDAALALPFCHVEDADPHSLCSATSNGIKHQGLHPSTLPWQMGPSAKTIPVPPPSPPQPPPTPLMYPHHYTSMQPTTDQETLTLLWLSLAVFRSLWLSLLMIGCTLESKIL